MFRICVADRCRNGISGVRVMVEFLCSARGVTDEAYTDSDGWAAFDGYDDSEIEVYIDGASHGVHRYEEGSSVTIIK